MGKHSTVAIVGIVLWLLSGCAKDHTGESVDTYCDVHKTPLRELIVPYSYGTPVLVGRDETDQTREHLFPHAQQSYHCGCVVGSCETVFVRRARVMACPQCNEAETRWRRAWEANTVNVESENDE